MADASCHHFLTFFDFSFTEIAFIDEHVNIIML